MYGNTISKPTLSTDEQQKKDASIEPELKRMGLDTSTWTEHFNNEGMKTKAQLQHIDRSTLNRLLKKTKYEWEKNALQKLYYEINEGVYLKTKNDFKELRNQLPDPQKYLTDTLKQDTERMKKAFEDKPWMTDINMEREMKRIQKEPSGEQIVQREPLKSSVIIRKIAAGQLLRGQFIHENLQKSSTYRQQLIEVDDNTELMSPGICETMETFELFDKKQSDEFDSVLSQFGIGFASGFLANVSKIANIEAKATGGYSNSSQRKTKKDTQESFVKIIQILVVPTASFTLSNQRVYLSKRALNALQSLNRRSSDKFDEYCKLFFLEFGSHYYTGVCHFGGRYKWTVTSSTDSEKNRSENHEIVKTALSGSVSGGYLWFAGEFKGGFEKDKERITGTRTYSESSKVTKKLEKFGGPQEVDDIKLWKKALAEHNSTWVIIEKDVSHKCYEGIWNLIQDHESEFTNAISFSKSIHRVWKELSKTNDEEMTWSLPQVFLDWKSESKRGVVLGGKEPDFPIVPNMMGPVLDERSKIMIDKLQAQQPPRRKQNRNEW